MMSNPHAETRELLPWLANGTLAGAELERVQRHLGACADCRALLDWERRLHAVRQLEPPLSSRQAFAALLPRLGAQDAGSQEAPAADPPQAGGHRQLEPRRWGGLGAANDPRWLRALAAVQLGVIAALALGLTLALVSPGSQEPGYRSLGAHAAAAGNIVVSFDPATPEHELRRILQASGGRVVDGPTATGAWVLAVEPSAARPALERLRAESVVTLAEPLAIESGR
jgi:hypothetical protein